MVTKKNGLSLDLIVHPGETIKELLENKNMNQEELAIRTGYSAKHVSEVISGKKSISSKFANALEYVFGIPTEFWINLQGNYDKEMIEIKKLAEIADEEFVVLKELKEFVNYCKNNSIIGSGLNKELTILNLRKFLKVNNLLSIANLPIQGAAFRGSSNKVNINVLYAWISLCEHLTEDVEPSRQFNKEVLKENIENIKKTMFLEPNKMIENLKKIFLNSGVVFEVVHNFTGAPVQGYIQKKNKKVILCMTIRQKYSDIFWFTLFHEIGHLLNDDFTNLYIDYTFEENDSEIKANNFARTTLINEDDYKVFLQNKKYSYNSIVKFAKTQNLKPGIVIGRIQNDTKNYSFLNQYREKYKWVNEMDY